MMFKITRKRKRILLITFIAILITYSLGVKFAAASNLDYFSDEPDDYGLIISDLARLPDFFEESTSPDQARLPHLITVPIIKVAGDNHLMVARGMYIIIHLLYLGVLYLLFRLTLSRPKALYITILSGLSAYLFSFSIFTMTTGSSLFLLLGTLILYLYLKYLKPPVQGYDFNRLAVFGVIAGLAVGSRFFAALILISIFIYDAWLSRSKLVSKSSYNFWSFPYETINIIFTVFWLLINVLPFAPTYRTWALFLLVLSYIAMFVLEYMAQKQVQVKLDFINRWIFIVHTAFITAIIASPIHLNIVNIIRVFEWSSTWHKAENYINPSRFDIFTIIGVKTGWLAGVMILLALFVIAKRKQMKKFMKTHALFVIIVLVNMLVFIKVKYVIAWYPLLLMPFFYLPLAYVFPTSSDELKRPLGVVILALLIFIPIHEQYRYWQLFPYGHSDGAQHGEQYVGWNKPGIISFESSRQLVQYIKSNQSDLPAGEINCLLVDNERYNPWAGSILTMALQDEGLKGHYCATKQADERLAPYVITSLYWPEEGIAKVRQNYEQEHVFTQISAPVATLWVLKE